MTEFATDPFGNPLPPGTEPNITSDTVTDLPSFTDIINNSIKAVQGSLDISDPTGLEQSTYDFNYRVFPEDLTMQDNGHYMVININVPVIPLTNTPRSDYGYRTTVLPNEFSKVDNVRFGNIPSVTGDPLPTGLRRETLSLPRTTRRIAESIALHMPNGGLVYTDDNQYEGVSMTAIAGGLMGAIAKSALGPKFLGQKTASLVDGTSQAIMNASKVAGYPINPRVEVLFANRMQRQWMFEVFMAPRTESEALSMKEIIKTLRFHAAPEIGFGGFHFTPPAEFDITFFRQGTENTNLPRINTCVLEKIDIDYAPQNGVYSTFKDGTPVAVRLSMGFREIEIVHKRRVLQGF